MIVTIIDAHEEVLKSLYKAGLISPCLFNHNEIYKDFKVEFNKMGGRRGAWREAVFLAAEKHSVSTKTVANIIARFSKLG